MKKLIPFLLIFLLASMAFAAGPPVKGARHIGTFSYGLIYSFTDPAGYGVNVDDMGYNTTTLDLYLSSSDPSIITHDFFVSKGAATAYWEWIIPVSGETETLYFYPLTGNQIDVWANP